MRTARRSKRDRHTRTVARLPEQALHERVLDLAAPLIERLGPAPTPEALRATLELAITFWNASASASNVWGVARPKQLNDLRRAMTGKTASSEDAEFFRLLSDRWRGRDLAFDPRLVGDWSLEVGEGGDLRLSCAMELPDGVEAEVPPPVEERVAIGGKALDEVRIRIAGPSHTVALLCFPAKHHGAAVGQDGRVTVHTKMPTAVALFAEGVLPPVGGGRTDLVVRGRKHEAMVLAEVRCGASSGHEVAVLIFEPAAAELTS